MCSQETLSDNNWGCQLVPDLKQIPIILSIPWQRYVFCSSSARQIFIWKLLLQAGFMHSRESWSHHLCKSQWQNLLSILRGAQFTMGWFSCHLSLYLYRGVAWAKCLCCKMFLFDSECRQTFRKIANVWVLMGQYTSKSKTHTFPLTCCAIIWLDCFGVRCRVMTILTPAFSRIWWR